VVRLSTERFCDVVRGEFDVINSCLFLTFPEPVAQDKAADLENEEFHHKHLLAVSFWKLGPL
jgi:hypothetical protein